MEISEKQRNRDSIVTHLKMLQSMGVTGFLRSSVPAQSTVVPMMEPGQNNLAPTKPVSTHNTLDDLRSFIGDCQRCKLCSGRKNIVFGVGNPKAELIFVGEGPGADEDEKGEPFVGRAGQLLTKMINAMGFERSDIYIANVVKCRPPENRNPEPDEIAACMPFLMQQIEIIKPKVIMCLGKFAAQTVLKTEITISRLRGHFQDVNGVAVMPTFHPAYLLRNPGMKKVAWEDCKLVMEKLGKTGK
jgi:DNA polymerase